MTKREPIKLKVDMAKLMALSPDEQTVVVNREIKKVYPDFDCPGCTAAERRLKAKRRRKVKR